METDGHYALNFDGDAEGDVCDADDDNDGVPDLEDCAPFNTAVRAVPTELGPTA